MALTATEIDDVLSNHDKPSNLGKVSFLHQRETALVGRPGYSRNAETFLGDLRAARPTEPPAPAYLHPAHDQAAMGATNAADALTPSDLVWLQRVPADPAAVPYDDAVTLARMRDNLSDRTNPYDARLVRSIATPVLEHHDRLAAESTLAAISRNPLPSSHTPRWPRWSTRPKRARAGSPIRRSWPAPVPRSTTSSPAGPRSGMLRSRKPRPWSADRPRRHATVSR
jgi:hypothetical protein